MKRIKYMLVASLLLSQMLIFAEAKTEYDVLSSMNIMTYTNGDFNESTTVTRGMLSKILVEASSAKDSLVTSGLSPFPDVSSSHWASPYVSLAVNEGIMRGYLDGTFKPDNHVKVEEVVTATLNLLGYTDILGSYPTAQMSKAESLGLLEGTTVSAGQYINRGDTATIIYNALNTKNAQGVLHSSTLGYSSSDLSVSDVLEGQNIEPTLISSAESFDGYKIYVDGATSDEIPKNSLAYINDDAKIIYAYTKKISGIVTEVLPNVESPESVVISGKEYKLSTTDAKDALSLDGYLEGDYVTCILDKNGDIGAVLPLGEEGIVGVVTKAYVESDGHYVDILSVDGDTLSFPVSSDKESLIGDLVEVSSDGTISGKGYNSSISGLVSVSSLEIGNYDVSSSVSILDISEDGKATNISLERLDGITLSKSDILYSESNGKITTLILDDVTNDSDLYVYITDTSASESKSSYDYDLKGVSYTKSIDGYNDNISSGPSYIETSASGTEFVNELEKVNSSYSRISGNKVVFENGSAVTLSSDVVVYKMIDGDPILSSLSDIDLESSSFYYDNRGNEAIRIIID